MDSAVLSGCTSSYKYFKMDHSGVSEGQSLCVVTMLVLLHLILRSCNARKRNRDSEKKKPKSVIQIDGYTVKLAVVVLQYHPS